nr:MAG TPA: putative secreted protein [Caudoviricetes sp.]
MITERPYTGLTAEIKVNNSVLGYMSGVDLTLEKSIIEVLQFGARYQEKVPAIKNWTANVDGTVAFTSGGSQHKLYQAFESDEEITVGIFLDDKVYFEGKAFVENLNITGAPDDKMNISCDLSGNGAITFTIPEVYLVDIHSGVGGTTTPGGSQKVAKGEQVEITITPAAGYALDKLMDNAEDKTTSVTSNKYTLTNVTADHEIAVTFKEG